MSSPGGWVLVRAKQARWVGLYIARTESGMDIVRVYRQHPERFVDLHVNPRRIDGEAPDSETLRAAKELIEIDSLRDRRKALGVTQRDFAELVGVGLGAVRDAEHGRRHTQRQVRHWLLEGLRKLEAQNRKQTA